MVNFQSIIENTHFKGLLSILAGFAVSGVVGYGLGRFDASKGPSMVDLVSRTELTQEQIKKQQVVTVEKQVNTVQTVIKYRTGPVEEKIVTETKSNSDKHETVAETKKAETKSTETENVTTNPPRNWMVGVGRSLGGSYEADLGYRVMGNAWVDSTVTSNGTAFLGLRVGF